MIQAVNRQHLTQDVRVRIHTNLCERFLVDQVTLGQGFLPALRLSPVRIIPAVPVLTFWIASSVTEHFVPYLRKIILSKSMGKKEGGEQYIMVVTLIGEEYRRKKDSSKGRKCIKTRMNFCSIFRQRCAVFISLALFITLTHLLDLPYFAGCGNSTPVMVEIKSKYVV